MFFAWFSKPLISGCCCLCAVPNRETEDSDKAVEVELNNVGPNASASSSTLDDGPDEMDVEHPFFEIVYP